jgi:hypothetical protein
MRGGFLKVRARAGGSITRTKVTIAIRRTKNREEHMDINDLAAGKLSTMA